MQKDDLDNYYSRFQHLATHAGFDCDAHATIDLFAKGLKPQLLQAILNRDNTPNTMDEWITAAQREQQKYTLKQTMLHPGKAWPMWETKPTKFNGGRTRRHPNDETVPVTTLFTFYFSNQYECPAPGRSSLYDLDRGKSRTG